MTVYDKVKESMGTQPKRLDKGFVYYAYLNGSSTCCDSSAEAHKISKIVEKVCVNEQDVLDRNNEIILWNKTVRSNWVEALKKEFLNDFNCLSGEDFNRAFKYVESMNNYDNACEDIEEMLFDLGNLLQASHNE
jgi:hypothetical protein